MSEYASGLPTWWPRGARPAVVVLSWGVPAWTWPQQSPAYPEMLGVLQPAAAPPLAAPGAGKHPHQAQ
jgi:hypothetical protein